MHATTTTTKTRLTSRGGVVRQGACVRGNWYPCANSSSLCSTCMFYNVISLAFLVLLSTACLTLGTANVKNDSNHDERKENENNVRVRTRSERASEREYAQCASAAAAAHVCARHPTHSRGIFRSCQSDARARACARSSIHREAFVFAPVSPGV